MWIQQAYSYQGLEGSISMHDTVYGWPDTFDRFRTLYSSNELGRVERITYPRCVTPACSGTPAGGASPVVDFVYDEGRLSSIPGWITSMEHTPGGLLGRITRANGTSDHQSADTHRNSRTGRLAMRALADTYGDAGRDRSILYGGSVKPDNAAELLGQPNIDGALIGGASLKADDFLAIAQASAATAQA